MSSTVRRFVPVPYDALDIAQSDAERLTILALYRRAHGARWRPMPLSRDVIAEWHGLTRHAVQRLLATMEAEMLIRWERAGKSGKSGIVEVLNPSLGVASAEAAGEAAPFRQVSRHPGSTTNADNDDAFVTFSSGEAAAEAAGEAAPIAPKTAGVAPDASPLNLNQNLKQNYEPSTDTRARPEIGDLMGPAVRYAEMCGRLPAFGRLALKEESAIGRLADRGVTAVELEALVSWIDRSGEEPARWLRERSLTWHSLARSDHWPVWMRDAMAWDARGRVDKVTRTTTADRNAAFLERLRQTQHEMIGEVIDGE